MQQLQQWLCSSGYGHIKPSETTATAANLHVLHVDMTAKKAKLNNFMGTLDKGLRHVTEIKALQSEVQYYIHIYTRTVSTIHSAKHTFWHFGVWFAY